jgi:hypothetical protein
MTIPAFGLIFIPVAVWIFLARPEYLVPLLVLSSIFEAASVLNLNFGNFPVGIQPYFFVALLLAIRGLFSLSLVRSRLRFLSPATKKVLWTLAAFWAWAVAGSFVLPVIFRGVGVIDPRSTLGQAGLGADVGLNYALYGALTPLAWSFRNLGQAVFLTLNVAAVIYAAAMGLKLAHSRRAVRALRAAIVIASLVVIAQALASWMNWSFPYSFFNTNPTYSQGYDQVIAGLRRGISTFTEASYAGGFLAASALGLIAAGLYSVRRGVLAASMATVGCVLTTASTGFATLALGGGLMAVRGSAGPLRSGRERALKWMRGRKLSLLLVTGAAVGVLLIVSPKLEQAALKMTVYKLGTLSAFGRFSAGLYSAGLALRTYGLGLGLGSNRPYDVLTYVLSNLGVVGIILFALFFVRLLRQLFAAPRRLAGSYFAMLGWMLLGLLIAQMAAIPDLNWPAVWAVAAVALSLLVSCGGECAGGTDRLHSGGDGRLPARKPVAP